MEQVQDLNPKPLSVKEYLVVSSMLFGLFFGAGNLIFPIHLGQLAGAHWGLATVGFFSYRGGVTTLVGFSRSGDPFRRGL